MAAKTDKTTAAAAALLVLGLLNMLISPGMPLNATFQPHGTWMLVIGGLVALLGAAGLAMGAMKK